MPEPLLQVKNLKKYFPVEEGFMTSLFSKKKSILHAVDGISFDINREETFGLAGESGSGKTTTARLILSLIKPTSGEINFEGRDITKLSKKEGQKLRRHIQLIFQDPVASLNPRMVIGNIIGEPLEIHKVMGKSDRRKKVMEALEIVGLFPASKFIERYPHELSGGQKQRVGIARALILNPKLVVSDEPVSALDVSVRSQILNLMQNLKREFKLTYMLIAHDLAVVRHMSDKIAIMYLGKLMELGSSEEVLTYPRHPYTKALIAAFPIPDPDIKRKRILMKGKMPSPLSPPSGCRLHPRCPCSTCECTKEEPSLIEISTNHYVACCRSG